MERIQEHTKRCFYTYRWAFPIAFCLLFCAGIAAGRPAWAFDDGYADGAYASGSGTDDNNGDINAPRDDAGEGPVRMARFSHVSGDVTWRGDSRADWSPATRNLPLRQGAQIWVSDGSRAELQFDDGSHLRLGSRALVTLQTLYSDADGEFTELTLNDGIMTLRLREHHSVYQVNTPLVSVKASGPAMIRIGASDGTQVGVQEGRATVEGPQGSADLQAGDYLDLMDDRTPYDVRELPRRDRWDAWNEERDREIDDYGRRPAHHYLPPNIAIVADGLDDYGSWRADPTYGEVWCPRTESADWRPYREGHWTWVPPFGWTWVSNEPWGWAPYHYGTWIRESYGWAWVPGPAVQYWSPACVHFYEYDGDVAWCPLAPAEVRYPDTLAIGYHHGDWFLSFSIGQAAVYYPTPYHYCEARPWSSRYVNHVTYVNNITNITNINNTTIVNNVAVNHNTYLVNHGFVPFNARAGGATMADARAFGGHGAYQSVPVGSASIFARGRPIAAPAPGHVPVAGPPIVRPTMLALTPARTYQRTIPVSPVILNRPVYRAPVQPAIARTSTPIGRTVTPHSVVRPSASVPDRTYPTVSMMHTRTPSYAAGPYNGSGVERTMERRPATTFDYGRDGVAHRGDSYRQSAGSVQTGRGTERERAADGLSPAQRAAMRARESLGLYSGTSVPSRSYTGDRTTTGRDRSSSGIHRGEYDARDSRPGYRSSPMSTSPERDRQPTYYPRAGTSAGRDETQYHGYAPMERSGARYGQDRTAPRYRADQSEPRYGQGGPAPRSETPSRFERSAEPTRRYSPPAEPVRTYPPDRTYEHRYTPPAEPVRTYPSPRTYEQPYRARSERPAEPARTYAPDRRYERRYTPPAEPARTYPPARSYEQPNRTQSERPPMRIDVPARRDNAPLRTEPRESGRTSRKGDKEKDNKR